MKGTGYEKVFSCVYSTDTCKQIFSGDIVGSIEYVNPVMQIFDGELISVNSTVSL